MLTRREFLKSLAVLTGAAVVIPQVLTAPRFTFYPGRCYGNWFAVTDYFDNELVTEVTKILEEDMAQYIPPEYRKHVGYIIKGPQANHADPLLQRGTAGWKYVPGGGSSGEE